MATVTPDARSPAPRLRAGAGAGRGRLPAADALERRARRRVCRRAAADAEGARDRAAARLAPRRGRLPAADRARARRRRARAAARACASRRSARSSPRSTPRRSSSATAEGIPNRDYGVPAVEVLDADLDADAADEELERLRIARRARRATAARSTTACCPPRPGSTSARSRSRRAAIPGQEPIARQHYRGKVNRAPARARGRRRRAEPGRRRSCYGEKEVGRVTSAVPGLALAYVRVEVPDDAELEVGGQPARLH